MNNNVSAVKAAYEAVARGQVEVLFGLLADDIRWRATGPGPLAGEYIGKAEIGRFFGKMGETYGDTFRLDVVDVLGSADRVIVLTEEKGEYRGQPVAWRSAHVYTFENERCVSFLSFQDDSYINFWSARRSGVE